MHKAHNANRRIANIEKIDVDRWMQYCLARRVKNQYRDDYDNQLVDINDVCIDHKTPLSLGGKNSNANVCLTSRQNNADKSAMSFDAWMRKLYSIGIINQWTSEIDTSDVYRQQRLFA
jgi:hypothetical protein